MNRTSTRLAATVLGLGIALTATACGSHEVPAAGHPLTHVKVSTAPAEPTTAEPTTAQAVKNAKGEVAFTADQASAAIDVAKQALSLAANHDLVTDLRKQSVAEETATFTRYLDDGLRANLTPQSVDLFVLDPASDDATEHLTRDYTGLKFDQIVAGVDAHSGDLVLTITNHADLVTDEHAYTWKRVSTLTMGEAPGSDTGWLITTFHVASHIFSDGKRVA